MRNINYKIVFTLASVCPWCFIIFCEVKLYTLLLPLFDPCLNPFPAIDPALLLSFCPSLCSNPRTLVWPLFLLLGIFLKLRVLLNLCLPTSLIVIPGISDWHNFLHGLLYLIHIEPMTHAHCFCNLDCLSYPSQ